MFKKKKTINKNEMHTNLKQGSLNLAVQRIDRKMAANHVKSPRTRSYLLDCAPRGP